MSGNKVNSINFLQFFMCALFLMLPVSADAQSSLDQLLKQEQQINSETRRVSPDDLTEIPNEYFDEAYAFHGKCTSTPHLNSYYDCNCMSAKLLDSRIEAGAETSQSTLLLYLDGQCKNTVNTAGTEYGKCMKGSVTLPTSIDAEEYCTCFSNTYSKIYGRSPAKPSSKLKIAIHKRAAIACRNPELAKRLYPEISGLY